MREFMAVTKALSDENRVRTLMFLREGELCVCQIIEMLGLAPSTVSKHLAILRQSGLIDSSKKGRWVYYNLAGEEASPVVRKAIGWVEDSLKEDKRVLEDDARVRKVRETCLEDLCKAYLNGHQKAA